MAEAMVLSWATPFPYFLNKATRCTVALFKVMDTVDMDLAQLLAQRVSNIE